MGIHSEKELEEKRKAIRKAAQIFASKLYRKLADDEMLFHEIESLYQLVQEYKRG